MTQQGFGVDMQIKGADKLMRGLKDPAILGRPVTIGMQQSALAVQREAAMRAPVDTGRLRGSIRARVGRRRPFPIFAQIGPKVEYGAAVEFGIKQRPQPYMHPGLRAAGEQINKIWADVGQMIVRGIARGR